MGDVGSLIEKGRLAEYLEKNNIKDLVVVGERDSVEMDMDSTGESPNKEASENISTTEADDSAISCTDSKHQAPAPVPARLAPPPSVAPRDPTKVSGKPI